MEKIEGHACPKCGCQESRVVSRVTEWGKAHERRRCGHCHALYAVKLPDPEPPKIVDHPAPLECPRCGSLEVKTTRTFLPMRAHKCRACDWAFQSVEPRRRA